MTIRTRLTGWYAGIMFLSLLAMGLLTYRQFALESSKSGFRPSNAEQDQDDASDLREVWQILFWCGVPAALLAVGGGWWLMHKALAPMVALTQATERTTARNLGEPLPLAGTGDELDRLTEVFNAMTARLNASFQRIHEFTLHASHELKTPLTVLQGELESALQTPGLTDAELQRLLSQLDEVQRLSRIVDGLTLLTKADAGQVQLEDESVPFDELVRDAWADAQILAKPCEVRVKLCACESAPVRGDRHRLRQLLLNLTDNAIKYNRTQGTVEIGLRRVAGTVELTMANTGPGVPPTILPRVFDRFFRGDPSHCSDVEGSGLGLSIVQWIVKAHGGSITFDSVPGQRTTVVACLPLANEQGEPTPTSRRLRPGEA